MKTEQIIENYCHLYGVKNLPLDIHEKRYFITISLGRADVLYLRKPSKLLGQIIGAAMKRGPVLYVCHKKVIPITWDNWKKIWSELFTPKVRDHNPVPNYSHPHKSEIFEEVRQKNVHKKSQRRGFERSFVANQSMNLLTPTLIPRIKI